MEFADVYVGGDCVAKQAPFQRIPVINELVWLGGAWHSVTAVGFNFTVSGLHGPIANVSLSPAPVHALGAPGPFPG